MLRRAAVMLLDRVPAGVAERFRNDTAFTRIARRVVNHLVASEARLVTVRSGPAKDLRVMIDPKAEKFYWTGVHEQHVQDALVAHLRPGMTFWDVGAHVGFLSLLASRLVGPSGSVVSLEPMPEIADRLRQGVDANQFGNVDVRGCAVGAATGEATLHAHEVSSMHSLKPDRPGVGSDGPQVPVTTLDALAQELGAPDLIKIDAEGAELDILRGSSELLAAHQPTLVVEFLYEERVTEARQLLGDPYRITHLADKDWLVTPTAPRHGHRSVPG